MAASADISSGHEALRTGRARASIGGAAWSAVNTLAATFAAAVLFYAASRVLGPAEFGVVALAASIVTIASAVAPAAFGEALIQRQDLSKSHIDTVFWLCMGAAVVLYILVLGIAAPMAEWLDEPLVAILLPLIGVKLGFEMLAVVPNALVVRRMRYRALAARTAIANAVAAAVCLALLAAGKGIWALAISQVANVAVAALVVLWASGWRPGIAASWQALRDLTGYGVYASGSRALNLLRVDQLLIGAISGAGAAGLFNFANRLFQMTTGLVSGAFGSVTHVLLSSMQNEEEKRREAFLMAMFGSAVVSFPIFAGLFLVAPQAVPQIFGDQWRDAVVPVQAFSVIGLCASVSIVQGSLLTSQGKPGWWFSYQVVTQATNLLLIILLLPWGLDAALTGIAAKTLLMWPVTIVMARKVVDVGWADYARTLAAPVAATVAMGVVVVVLNDSHLAIRIGIGAAVYSVTAGLLGLNKLKRILGYARSKKARG